MQVKISGNNTEIEMSIIEAAELIGELATAILISTKYGSATALNTGAILTKDKSNYPGVVSVIVRKD